MMIKSIKDICSIPFCKKKGNYTKDIRKSGVIVYRYKGIIVCKALPSKKVYQVSEFICEKIARCFRAYYFVEGYKEVGMDKTLEYL